MDRTADLHSALNFVIDRIAEQANLSGEPLSREQRLLLDYLPSSWPVGLDPEMPQPVPRNIDLEQVFALGKTAYQHDRQENPASSDWEFALAVFTIARHPMAGLLQMAGMKPSRTRWDSILLVATALLVIAYIAVALIVLKADGAEFSSVVVGSGCAAIVVLMFLASRRVEKQHLQKEIERCRLASRFSSEPPVELKANRKSPA